MDPSEIENLERATVAAVAPPDVAEIRGWLVPFDDGTVGRAKSAVPLRHDASPDVLDEIEAAYRGRGLRPAFRIADVQGLAAVRAEIVRRGYHESKPTQVMVADAQKVAGFAIPFADLLETPDEAWRDVFLGEGFDPEDGAHRVKLLSSSPDALYGAVREGGRTVAVGVVSFGYGWAGVHGMRTALERRGAGFASRLLTLFGTAALARGCERIFLQVEAANPALRLYRRAGFEPVWTYGYWA